jgi:hypothetical protein
MSSKTAKSALATFRLSQEEYEESKRACSGLGYRSFSEFARVAILSRLRDGPNTGSARIEARLDHFERTADEVCRLLRQIHALMGQHEPNKD